MIIKAKVLNRTAEIVKDIENCVYWCIIDVKTKHGCFEYSQFFPSRKAAERFVDDCVSKDYVEIEK